MICILPRGISMWRMHRCLILDPPKDHNWTPKNSRSACRLPWGRRFSSVPSWSSSCTGPEWWEGTRSSVTSGLIRLKVLCILTSAMLWPWIVGVFLPFWKALSYYARNADSFLPWHSSQLLFHVNRNTFLFCYTTCDHRGGRRVWNGVWCKVFVPLANESLRFGFPYRSCEQVCHFHRQQRLFALPYSGGVVFQRRIYLSTVHVVVVR